MNDTPKPKRGRPPTLDAEKTLDVAMRAYWASDPADVSINSICTLAGVSKPALYRVFGNEDGLMRAVLDRYAETVLSDIFDILSRGGPFADTLAALVTFGAVDAKMETGCVFFKMRAGKHRLGPETRARVGEVDKAAVAAFAGYLAACRAAGTWTGAMPDAVAARYLVEQIGLALSQRAAGEDAEEVKATMELALSAL
ncbi:MAG: TetR/AcrR family transcriptional regulator [Pseudomonadota bacterium]